ncbi:MAG: hypothetical protein VX785_06470 [Actinomycetota bacterium]|nr:hypothetical protein [Acidimicrobiales bacterium]MEC9316337.1 hypothetical protein [Actinomycetota bacterium]MED5552332.1 hypothetical protein [Actinomycetota bacterium]MEE3187717.1 hypothetical protein [Actinomycetota bacterium]
MNSLNDNQSRAADALWDHYQRGADLPDEAFEGLDFNDGLAIQAEIRRRRLENGAVQIGWKVGLTSDRARRQAGIDDRPFGHLMQKFESGVSLVASSVNGATIEPEMCFTIGEQISGPDVDPKTVPSRIERVSAGYELNERRAIVGGNLAMLVADNLTNWAIVEGSGVAPDEIPDIDEIEIVQYCNDEERFRCVHREQVDNPFVSIARLAATLHRFEMSIEVGQKVITGAYTRYAVASGENWVADYSGIGRVETSYQ